MREHHVYLIFCLNQMLFILQVIQATMRYAKVDGSDEVIAF